MNGVHTQGELAYGLELCMQQHAVVVGWHLPTMMKARGGGIPFGHNGSPRRRR